VIHGFIKSVVGLVHHLDMAQVLHAEGRFEAGDEQPYRVTLLDTQRLAILAIGHENVVQGLSQRKGVRKLARVRAFRNQPARLFFRPTSFNNTESGTPVHSLQLLMPCTYWTGGPMLALPV